MGRKESNQTKQTKAILMLFMIGFGTLNILVADHYIIQQLIHLQLNLCKTATLKKTNRWFSKPIID